MQADVDDQDFHPELRTIVQRVRENLTADGSAGILQALSDGHPQSVGELQERTGRSRASIHRWLSGLIAAGKVEMFEHKTGRTYRLPDRSSLPTNAVHEGGNDTPVSLATDAADPLLPLLIQGGIQTSALVEALGLSPRKAQRILKTLEKEQLLVRRGRGRSTRYLPRGDGELENM